MFEIVAQSPSQRVEIAVIGAGVVGMACALRLAQAGHEVALIDPADAGSGASYGNAGTIADYAVMPVGTPAVLRDLPRLLLDRASPLAIRRSAIGALAPWLARFAWQSLPRQAARNAAAIAALVADAAPRWQEFAAEIGGQALLQDRGALYFYDSAAALSGAASDMAQRRDLGIDVQMLDQAGLRSLEPNLPAQAGAAYFPNARFLSDPAAMMARLQAACLATGVAQIRAAATALSAGPHGIDLALSNAQALRAAKVVLAAGAHSKPLARMAGDKIPLDTERGYHLEWDMASPLLSRPCCHTRRGFYLCPMQGRLRVAGTVELGGLRAPISRHRLQVLRQGADEVFADLGPPSREWMGFRPSLPDSLPVIGAGRDGRIFHAFGHGHIGLTLAPVTAQMTLDAISGVNADLRAAPCRPQRFA